MIRADTKETKPSETKTIKQSQSPIIKKRFTGTYAEYMSLPYEVKQYYTPPVETPAGYEYYSSKVTVSPPLPDLYNPAQPLQKVEEITFVPKSFYVEANIGFFGPQTSREATPEEAAILKKQAAEGTLVTRTMESKALTGLGLATVTATGVTTPVLGAAALGGVGVGETAKVAVTGKHLTIEEGVAAAGIGQIIGVGALGAARALQPRVQRGIDTSYQKAIENFEIWKPTTTQKIGIKVTGAKPPSLASEVVGAGEPGGITLEMLKQGKTIGPEEDYFWDVPAPKSVQVYVRQAPKTQAWAETTLVKRAYLEGLFTTTISTKILVDTELKPKAEMPYIPSTPDLVKAESVLPSGFQGAFAGVNAIASLGVSRLSRQKVTQTQRQSLAQRTANIVTPKTSQTPKQGQSQKPVQSLVPVLETPQVTIPKVKIPTTQIPIQIPSFPQPPTVTVPKTPKFPLFPLGGGDAGTPTLRGFSGAWFKRKHPVKTSEQMLKTFGFGRTGRTRKTFNMNIKQISKMEVPGFTRKSKRKKRRHKKR